MALIRRLSRENPLLSPERIKDTLMLLGVGAENFIQLDITDFLRIGEYPLQG